MVKEKKTKTQELCFFKVTSADRDITFNINVLTVHLTHNKRRIKEHKIDKRGHFSVCVCVVVVVGG